MTDEEIIEEMAGEICCEQACFNCDIANAGNRDCERAARAGFTVARARIREQCAEEAKAAKAAKAAAPMSWGICDHCGEAHGLRGCGAD